MKSLQGSLSKKVSANKRVQHFPVFTFGEHRHKEHMEPLRDKGTFLSQTDET